MTKVSWTLALVSAALTYGFVPKAHIRNQPSFVKGSSLPLSGGIDITFDFDKFFRHVKQVSPLAKTVMEFGSKGDNALENETCGDLKWKTVEKREGGALKKIEKLESFDGIRIPLLRFRAEIPGPCWGEKFGRYILDLDSRRKWDSQIENVYELHGFPDLDPLNIAMGFGRRYGDVSRMGIGYGQTKAGIVTPREQMFLYGMQEFPNGSCILWGSEMDEKYNFLLPAGAKRHTRAKSHLFSATLVPNGPDKFDVEYVVQMEIGGGVPAFLTTPVVIETVKKLFDLAQVEFGNMKGAMEAFLGQKDRKVAESLLMTP